MNVMRAPPQNLPLIVVQKDCCLSVEFVSLFFSSCDACLHS
jgi:hypothetical protein